MANVKVTCDTHGDRVLKPSGVHVTVRSPGKTTLEFFSPCCRRYQVKEIGNAAVAGLRKVGVAITLLEVPPEFFEEKSGPPLRLSEVNVWLLDLYDSRFRAPSERVLKSQ